MPLRAEQHVSSVGLRSCPASTAHRFDDGCWSDVVEVASGGRDAGVAELAGDDSDVYAFGAELGGVRVAEAVGVDALVDACPGRQAFEQNTDVGGSHRVTLERAEDGVAAREGEAALPSWVETDAGPHVEPALDDGGGDVVGRDPLGRSGVVWQRRDDVDVRVCAREVLFEVS